MRIERTTYIVVFGILVMVTALLYTTKNNERVVVERYDDCDYTRGIVESMHEHDVTNFSVKELDIWKYEFKHTYEDGRTSVSIHQWE